MNRKYRLDDLGRHDLAEYLPAVQDRVPRRMRIGCFVVAMQLWRKEPVARLGRAKTSHRVTLPRRVQGCQAPYQLTDLLQRHRGSWRHEETRHVTHDDHVPAVRGHDADDRVIDGRSDPPQCAALPQEAN